MRSKGRRIYPVDWGGETAVPFVYRILHVLMGYSIVRKSGVQHLRLL